MIGKRLKREYLHEAQTEDEVSFVVDTLLLPSGKQVEYYFTDSPYQVVAIVAMDDRRNVALIRQYRHIVDETLTEVPSGSPSANESLLEGARRELAEEAGVAAKVFEELGTFYTSVGTSNQRVTVFLASDVSFVAQHLDETEEIEVEWVSLTQAVDLVRRGLITNQTSAVAILLAALHVDR
jgi:ADP-ribose pyrophosphatase